MKISFLLRYGEPIRWIVLGLCMLAISVAHWAYPMAEDTSKALATPAIPAFAVMVAIMSTNLSLMVGLINTDTLKFLVSNDGSKLLLRNTRWATMALIAALLFSGVVLFAVETKILHGHARAEWMVIWVWMSTSVFGVGACVMAFLDLHTVLADAQITPFE